MPEISCIGSCSLRIGLNLSRIKATCDNLSGFIVGMAVAHPERFILPTVSRFWLHSKITPGNTKYTTGEHPFYVLLRRLGTKQFVVFRSHFNQKRGKN
jgi:hypothetical protein